MLDTIMLFITNKNSLLFFSFVVLVFLRDKKKTCIALVIALASFAVADWSSDTLKQIFERQRPCHVLDGVHLLVVCSSSYSMPSRHAANAFAFATAFYILLKTKMRYIFVIAAAFTGFSRIYVGVHYPSDVLCGALLGIALAVSIIGLYSWSSKKL